MRWSTRDGVEAVPAAESRLLLDGVTIDFADTPAKTGSGLQRPEAACTCGSHYGLGAGE